MPEDKDKKLFDEQTLAKVLEAAFVLQENNAQQQKKKPETHPAAAPAKDSTPVLNEARTKDKSALAQSTYGSPSIVKTGSGFTLAQIVEVQHQIQVLHLELENAMALVVERLSQIAGAGGAAIGIVAGPNVVYRAGAGSMALPVGSEIATQKALCAECLRSGKIFQCPNVESELLLDADECRRRGIQSMLAVPIFHAGDVAGSLEIYFGTPSAFAEEDVHPCQLMAGLVTEALTRDEELTRKKSIASERAVMLEALEKLQPNLAALVDTRAGKISSGGKGPAERTTSPATKIPAPVFICRKCGHQLVGEEQFCGNCGSPRSSDYEPPSLQSKVASLWNMQESMKKTPPLVPPEPAAILEKPAPAIAQPFVDQVVDSATADQISADKALAESLKLKITELFAAAESLGDESIEDEMLPATPHTAELQHSMLTRDHSPQPLSAKTQTANDTSTIDNLDEENAAKSDLEISPELTDALAHEPIPHDEVEIETPEETALVKPERPAAWSSAATARDFLEQLALVNRSGGVSRFWSRRRGDVYLAVAVLLVACALRWGILSRHSVSTPTPVAHRKSPPEAELPLYDRILVKLGLAEAPEPPVYKGNPGTQVWEDTRTALYYCPGSDLYGKTPKGKFASQREAQLDQFEPGYRKACE